MEAGHAALFLSFSSLVVSLLTHSLLVTSEDPALDHVLYQLFLRPVQVAVGALNLAGHFVSPARKNSHCAVGGSHDLFHRDHGSTLDHWLCSDAQVEEGIGPFQVCLRCCCVL